MGLWAGGSGKEYGYYAAAALFVGPTLTTVVNNQFYQNMFRLGIHVSAAHHNNTSSPALFSHVPGVPSWLAR